jgi:hypothetical protein
MANALYLKWKEQLLSFTTLNIATNNNLAQGNVKVALSRASYLSTDQFYSAISGSTVGTPQLLSSKNFTDGVFDAADVTFLAVPAGSAITALILYIDTGTASTSPLVAFIDAGVTGLPVTPNGGDITVTWNASGIFKL